ncbi:MAG: hypothetical protein H7101_02945 [Deinococcales bacterium]|nr:hypothetical protein [Chitinophagaceae bacterium]
MRKYLLFTSLLLLLISSCQKSIVWDDLVLLPPSTPVTPITGGTSGTLLDKIVSLSNTDTITLSYAYDASKRLIKETQVGISNGDKVDQTKIFKRDASGKIIENTMIEYSTTATTPSKYDTTNMFVHYPTGSLNFDYAIQTEVVSGSSPKDSITFQYTANKITRVKSFFSNSLSIGYKTSYQVDYSYDANGNLAGGKIYTYTTGTAVLAAEYIFVYDTKKSPLILGNEAFLTLGENYVGSNNVTSLTTTDKINAGGSIVIAYTFGYNANNFPATANGTATYPGLGSQSLKLTYFYQ